MHAVADAMSDEHMVYHDDDASVVKAIAAPEVFGVRRYCTLSRVSVVLGNRFKDQRAVYEPFI